MFNSNKAGAGRRSPAIAPWRQALRPESLLLSALLALAISSPLLYRQQHSAARQCKPAAAPRSTFRRSEGFEQNSPEYQFAKRALVIYVFSGSDPEYEANLQFFVREAIQADDECDYIIALQHGGALKELEPLPRLPSNARYVHHVNECLDIGTIGWVLENHVLDTRRYRFFVWVNSSVRGPFLPAYMRGAMHWTEALTGKLSESVKLVGATINCGGGYFHPDPQPHVQSYAVAMDTVGLDVLRRKSTVLKCYSNMAETVTYSEIGMSMAILEAGYNIDSLMLRYQGVDWRDPRAAACNGGRNPIQQSFYDGINADPLEVLFIKVKGSMRRAGWDHVTQAVKYDQWLQAQRVTDAAARYAGLAQNGWAELVGEKLREAARHGPACFDRTFYVSSNRFDLGYIEEQADPQAEAWHHFMNAGIHEGRPHRWTC